MIDTRKLGRRADGYDRAMAITHWRVYFPCAIGTANSHHIEVSDENARELMKAMESKALAAIPLAIGRDPSIRDFGTLYVNAHQVVALEPRED